MRKILIILILLLGLYFIFMRHNEFKQVLLTLQQGEWLWLVLAVVVQLGYVLNIGASLRAIYKLLGMEEKIGRLALLGAAANFVIVVAPSAGMGGMAVLAADAQERGHSTGRASTAGAVYTFFDYLATLSVVVVGLFILFQRNQLHPAEITASLILTGLALGLGFLLYLGMRSGEKLGRALIWLGRITNRALHPLIKREYIDTDRAYTFGVDAAEGLRLARISSGGLWIPLALGLTTKILMMTILFLMFLAFRQPYSVAIIVAGFSMGQLFTVVSPTPSGVGFVETAMTLALNSLGVPLVPAALIVLGYRGFTLWLTMLYGLIGIRWVGISSRKDKEYAEIPVIEAEMDPPTSTSTSGK
ncbi:MAG: hypothetical protein A2Z14_01080 [Chloroflexi bacterium RBG_16_48_8]|nr:MAG: hypothetical protein A2Z14_01080 [Chloroflexi bacterium RBG_16_48_8]